MKITVINLLVSDLAPEVVVEHNGAQLNFSVSSFGRKSLQQEFDPFAFLNAYWAYLPEERQANIFKAYEQIFRAFNEAPSRKILEQYLKEPIHQLMAENNYEDVFHWVNFYRDDQFQIPATFQEIYEDSIDRQGSRGQTYLRVDYIRLIALAIAFRSLIPVWGTYIDFTRSEIGNQFKEYYAFMLIQDEPILQSPAYEKLRLYIELTVGDNKVNEANVLEGIGSAIYIDWMMSLVVIRRLCMGDIRGQSERANLVTYVHKFVTSKMNGTDIPADSNVKPKTYDENGSDMDAKLSALERYKIKYSIALGDIVELAFSVSDLPEVARRLKENIPEDLLYSSLRSSQQLIGKRLLDPQINLVRWVLKPVISPRGFLYLEEEHVCALFGVVQAMLVASGHPFLGVLATSYASIGGGEDYITGIDSRGRIPKETQEKLDALYPFQKLLGGKRTGQKPVNLALKSIEDMAKDFSKFSWIMTAEDSVLTSITGEPVRNRRLTIPHDIKTQLANLVVCIGERNWAN